MRSSRLTSPPTGSGRRFFRTFRLCLRVIEDSCILGTFLSSLGRSWQSNSRKPVSSRMISGVRRLTKGELTSMMVKWNVFKPLISRRGLNHSLSSCMLAGTRAPILHTILISRKCKSSVILVAIGWQAFVHSSLSATIRWSLLVLCSLGLVFSYSIGSAMKLYSISRPLWPSRHSGHPPKPSFSAGNQPGDRLEHSKKCPLYRAITLEVLAQLNHNRCKK